MSLGWIKIVVDFTKEGKDCGCRKKLKIFS
jgi:hypothetical protein